MSARRVIVAATVTFSIASSGFTGYWEGKRNKVYLDPLHIPTVCYGHTGADVKAGDVWSDDECYAQLETDAKPCWEAADRYVVVPLANYQQAALMDFCVNGGVGGLAKSPMVKFANRGDWIRACDSFVGYYETGADHRSGQRIYLPGLHRRRVAEASLCHGNDVVLE